LIRVKYAGICGSDIGGFLGINKQYRPPVIMGQGFSGVIKDVRSMFRKML